MVMKGDTRSSDYSSHGTYECWDWDLQAMRDREVR